MGKASNIFLPKTVLNLPKYYIKLMLGHVLLSVGQQRHSVPDFRLAAWGWLTGCWPSPGREGASDWVGARKGTNECQGKTGTDRGSTLVHTAEENSILCY